MKKLLPKIICLFIVSGFITVGHVMAAAKPANPPANFKHHLVKVNGINIHYVSGGKGEPLLLIHGFGQNWYMWNRLLPELSQHFTIIAPDLRGLGESAKPMAGYDKKTMAGDIHGTSDRNNTEKRSASSR